jgi:hypothetical protein
MRCGFITLLVFLQTGHTQAQTPDPRPHLKALAPGGAQAYVSENYGAINFGLVNPTSKEIDARVLTFYAGTPAKQYGRDIWVPAKAALSSWFMMGPPVEPPTRSLLELKSLLYERTGKEEHLIRSPEGQPQHSDLVRFEKREPITTLMLDADIDDGSQVRPSAEEAARAAEVRELARVFRHQGSLSSRLSPIRQRLLPPIPDAFDGVDQFVLASDRLAEDAVGQQALRGWLQRGGFLWIPLDLVQEETVAALLGDVLKVQVVDRVSLTSVRFAAGSANVIRPEAEPREFEQPVPFVQVLAPGQPVFYTVDGWPAAFATQVGRGRVLFTTLGAAGWTRARLTSEPRSRMQEFPDLPVALLPFQYLADEFKLRPERPLLADEDLRTYVSDQISYKVVSRSAVLLVFGALFVALVLAAFSFIKKGGLEHLGWLSPALALVTAVVFIGLGERSRGAVPPTVAVAQLIDVVPGATQAQASGILGAYQPSLGHAPVGAENGGAFELDTTGLEGRVYARVQTDAKRWHWENLELPTGVRLAPFQYSVPTGEQVGATVRFGAEGAEGRLRAGPFRQLEDALLVTPGRHALPVQADADGGFRVAQQDGLQGGQLIAGGLLSDRQRARQNLYEKLLADPQPRFLANQALLLAWADPVDMRFSIVEHARLTGASLVMMPIQFERTPAGSSVTIPPAFVDCQRVDADGHLLPAAFESRLAAIVKLRFQLPRAVLPLTVDSARLTLKLHAAARDVVVNALVGGEEVPLHRVTSPDGVMQIEISDPRLLKADDQGAIYVNISIGELRGKVERDNWRIEWPGLLVKGHT